MSIYFPLTYLMKGRMSSLKIGNKSKYYKNIAVIDSADIAAKNRTRLSKCLHTWERGKRGVKNLKITIYLH